MEANPYAAPAAVVEDAGAYCADDLEARKASRGKRLGAAVLDGFTGLIWLLPMFWGVAMRGRVGSGLKPGAGMTGLIALGFVLLAGVMIINGVLLYRRGQTIGKRVFDIAILRTDGTRAALTRVVFLRALPIKMVLRLPFFSLLFWPLWLVDALMIFRDDRRCLHDLIADTIVVDV